MTEIIEEEVVQTASSQINEENKYYPIIIGADGTSFSITNNGTAAAPCRVTIIPKNDIMLLTIEGLSDDKIEIQGVLRGQILILDGIDRKITLDDLDAYDIYNGWEFPKLQPGVNTIKITNADLMTLSIEYQPRYI